MTLGSLFDGIGGWQLAAVRNNVTPMWSSEIEKFPCAVTQKHFPQTVQLGDVNQIDGAKIPAVDIICAGSPCQDLSVAGKREGIGGERSGLFFRAVDIVRQMRRATANKYPQFFVWENVTGAFTSNGGLDFRAVLEEITESAIPMPKSGRWANAGMVRGGKCEVAWRVLDAQYFGVPQRRRRIFLIADFTDGRAAEILFERQSLSRDTAKGGGEKQNPAEGIRNSVDDTGDCLTAWDCQSKRIFSAEGKSPTLCHTETCGSRSISIYENHGQDCRWKKLEKVSQTVSATFGMGGNNTPFVAGTLNARDYKGVGNQYFNEGKVQIDEKQRLRRLTPLECERLQGLPDGWTDGGSDAARYKAIGNGMAQPCADWIIQRITDG